MGGILTVPMHLNFKNACETDAQTPSIEVTSDPCGNASDRAEIGYRPACNIGMPRLQHAG
jgi:hypothetical protein